MSLFTRDREIVRDLARQVAEIAALPVQEENHQGWQQINQLQPTRPRVAIFQVPWHEMNVNDELTCRIEDPTLRAWESRFRMTLYQWRHFRDDQIISPVLNAGYAISDTGFGVSEQSDVNTDSGLASRHFHEQFNSLADVEKIRLPEVTHDEAATARNFEFLSELFGDLMPIEQRGIAHLWFTPWDLLITWYGVQQAMLDMVLRPELVNACVARLVDGFMHRLLQWEDLNLLSLPGINDGAGSGGPACTPELPRPGYDPKRITTQDLWGCGAPQIFSEVSPEMHWEFSLRHEMRWLERWGLVYYGCCEPLHHKVDLLRRIPTLRKISISPKADKAVAATNIGTDFVVSLKPNPAILAMDPWNPELARRELREDLEKLRGCVVEIILKDVSTIRFDPPRLWEWADIARDVATEFA
jgi:hypothetical protein